eukprot:CAMPEP_0184019066 /NCGR_PEP_ID=MMETSP0954-20121128/8532_1 /TAXON_ID=627963 /ORGANISM="Aplanochytrium sp, Strain PBS07" /LENGTH=399 /DNA_ID=CAMNT_0026300665 /DNA_START=158 /DNA_END=1354 /DNA_ORIENTATION=+
MDGLVKEQFRKEEAVRDQEVLNLLSVELKFVESHLLDLLQTVIEHSGPTNVAQFGQDTVQTGENGVSQKNVAVTSGLVNKAGDLHISHKTIASNTPSASSAAPSRWFSSSSHSWMDVSMHLDGYLIRHAQISLKLNKLHSLKKSGFRSTGSQPTFSTQIRQPRYPLVINQLLQVYTLALKELQRIQKWKGSRCINNIVETEGRKSVLPALEMIDGVMLSLRKAIDVLCSPSKDVFPQKAPDHKRAVPHFEPQLPSDLLIQCSVLKDELIVVAYVLHSLAKAPKRDSALEDSWMYGQSRGMDFTGKTFTFSGRAVEVVEQVQVRFSVHSIGFVLDSLCEAHNVARKMKRKLEAHVDLEYMMADEQRRIERAAEAGNSEGGHGEQYDSVPHSDPNITVSDW